MSPIPRYMVQMIQNITKPLQRNRTLNLNQKPQPSPTSHTLPLRHSRKLEYLTRTGYCIMFLVLGLTQISRNPSHTRNSDPRPMLPLSSLPKNKPRRTNLRLYTYIMTRTTNIPATLSLKKRTTVNPRKGINEGEMHSKVCLEIFQASIGSLRCGIKFRQNSNRREDLHPAHQNTGVGLCVRIEYTHILRRKVSQDELLDGNHFDTGTRAAHQHYRCLRAHSNDQKKYESS
jgi:hypothetical protein